MGDRSNVVVLEQFRQKDATEAKGVYLYSHWGGPDLVSWTAEAMATDAARGRWDDGPYLTRIIFQHILVNHAIDAETGWGIWMGRPDNEYPILVIDPLAETVRVMKERDELDLAATPIFGPIPFEEFVANPSPAAKAVAGS